MIDRLRLFLNRPLRDADRPRLFAFALVVIVAAAGVLASLHDARPAPQRTRAVTGAVAPFAGGTATAAIPSPSPTRSAPSEESRVSSSSPASRGDVAGAKRAGRGFLAGYLPYSYRRGRADGIRGATAELRRRLARQTPRVPASERRLDPRLILLQSDVVTRRRAQLLALVGDGTRRYTLRLELARRAGGWMVTDVGT